MEVEVEATGAAGAESGRLSLPLVHLDIRLSSASTLPCNEQTFYACICRISQVPQDDMSVPISFQIISDLHLESHTSYNDFKFPQTAPYLALLGDIGHASNDELFSFLERQIRRYKAVFYLLGNNEPYGLSLSATKERVQAFAFRMDHLRATSANIGKFIFLDQTRYDLDEHTTVLGCTLYSNILHEQANAVSARLGDFRYIEDWDVSAHNAAHRSDLAWLDEQIRTISSSEPERRIMVFTHHSPTLSQIASHPKNRGSPITSGFATDLRGEQCWESKSVFLWAFGHTHYNCDFYESGKRVVANQKGSFLSPQRTFDPCRVFEHATSLPDPS